MTVCKIGKRQWIRQKKKEGLSRLFEIAGQKKGCFLSGRPAVGRQRRVYAHTLLGGVRGVERAADARCKSGFSGWCRHDSLGLDRLLRAYRRTGAVVRRLDVLARGCIPHSVRFARPAVRTSASCRWVISTTPLPEPSRRRWSRTSRKSRIHRPHDSDLVNVVATVVVMLVIFFLAGYMADSGLSGRGAVELRPAILQTSWEEGTGSSCVSMTHRKR